MPFWKFDKLKHTSFDEGALKDGALKDAVVNMVKGDSPAVAIANAITQNTGEASMDSKPFWKSASFLGLITLAAQVLAPKIGISTDQVPDMVANLGQLASTGVALWGIFRRKDIHVLAPK